MIKMKEIYTPDVEWDGTEAWIICAYTNILFRFDSMNMEYEYVALLPEHGIENYDFHSSCVKYGNRVYCLPKRGQNIYIYDLDLKLFRKINLKSTNGNRIYMCKLCVKGCRLYTVSYGMKQIIEIDMQKEKIVSQHLITTDEVTINKAICYHNMVYAVSDENNILIQYDLENFTSNTIYFDDRLKKISGLNVVGASGGRIWMGGYDNRLYVWDMNDKVVSKYLELPKDIKFYNFTDDGTVYSNQGNRNCYFYDCVFFDDSVWFIPCQTNKIVYVKEKDNIVNELFIEEKDKTIENVRSPIKRKYDVVKIVDEKYFVLRSLKNDCYYKINVENETVEPIFVDVKYKNLDELWYQYGSKNVIMSENSSIDRNLLTYELAHSLQRKNCECGTDNLSIGEYIYNNID